MSIYSTRKSKNQENGLSNAQGPLARTPGAPRGGTFPKLSTFLSQLKGDPSKKKPIFEKSHNAEKLKGGTLWGFSTSILSQNIKKLKGGKIYIFGKKSHNAKKTEKGDSLGFFNIHSVVKQQKN